jgi:NAD(P)-dependent dehydrogenase (short-subunit alcohol dehydrogenase family)
LVTGGAIGIGKATAMLLADAGARVIVADIDLPGAQAVAAAIGRESVALGFDLTDDDSIAALLAAVEARCGRLDILINNAAIYPKYPFDALTQADWQQMQQVNIWGCFAVLRASAALMRKGGLGGRIVNLSSIGGVRTAVNHQLAYNASKAALDSITKSAALELAVDSILVNSIQPGAVSPLDPKPHPPGHVPPTGPLLDPGRILLGRAALPEEIAGPILMLASGAGGYITGQSIIIDGGFAVS